MKKLTLRLKRRIIWGLLLVGVAVVCSVALEAGYVWRLIIGGALMIAGITLEIVWWRCPYCNAYLSRHRDGDYYKECGKRVFWRSMTGQIIRGTDHGVF